MKKVLWFLVGSVLVAALIRAEKDVDSAEKPQAIPHRSPVGVAILPEGELAVTANQTADSASLVDLSAGKVLDEQPCGRKPAAIACSPDGKVIAVANLWSGTVTLFKVADRKLHHDATIHVGPQPRGVIFAPTGESLYVAVGGADEIAHVQLGSGKVVARWPAPTEPWRLVLTKDGRFLVAACGRSGEVRCWDTAGGKELWNRRIFNAFNLHGLTLTPDEKDVVVAYVHHRGNPMTKNHISEGWALNSRLAKMPLQPKPDDDYVQIGMDVRAEAVGDPCAVTFTPDGEKLLVVAGGTQELLAFTNKAVYWNTGDAGDFLDSALQIDPKKLRRISLQGRPVDVHTDKANKHAVIANYLLDAIQVVDLGRGEVTRTISLGGPSEISLARQGEAMFYDAKRSHHQWFSCHTCHTDGHTCVRLFDTLNDESYGNPKMVPTLRNVTRTGPYTWHGWQEDLNDAVVKSFTETMFGPKPTPEEVKAFYAFLETLEHPPTPTSGDESQRAAIERGRALFAGKANCNRCHDGKDYTSELNRKVGVETDYSPFELWNPPTLLGLRDRGPYMHDGRAANLDAMLRVHHAPEKLGGEALTPDERKDLIAFLLSL